MSPARLALWKGGGGIGAKHLQARGAGLGRKPVAREVTHVSVRLNRRALKGDRS